MKSQRGDLKFGRADYCACEFYLDRLDRISSVIKEAFTAIEPPITPAKLKAALLQLLRSGKLS